MAEIRLPCVDGEVTGLPPVCMCCGHPATVVKGHVFNGDQFWGLDKNVLVQMPLCDNHEHYWHQRIVIALWTFGLWVLVLLIWGVGIFLVMPIREAVIHLLILLGVEVVTGLFLLLPLSIWLRVTLIRARRTGEHSITLCGVAEEFAQRVAGSLASQPDAPRPVAGQHLGIHEM